MIDYIGKNILYFVIIYSVYVFKDQHVKGIYFIIGLIISIVLTIILKNIIKQPLPREDNEKFKTIINNSDFSRMLLDTKMFGMPSGHAITVTYSLIFISMVRKVLDIVVVLIWIFTLVTSVCNNHHYFSQVLVGFFIGVVMGKITYDLSVNRIKGLHNEKKDDNCY